MWARRLTPTSPERKVTGERSLATAAGLPSRDRVPGAGDGVEQVALVHLDADETQIQLCAGDGGGPKSHERIRNHGEAIESMQTQAHLGKFGRERRRMRPI